MFKRVKARVQELWGKEVISESEAYAQAICEEIESAFSRAADSLPKPTVKKAKKGEDE